MRTTKYKSWSRADEYQLLRFMNVPEKDRDKAVKNAAQIYGVSEDAIKAKYNRLTTGKNKVRIVKPNTPSNTPSPFIKVKRSMNTMVIPITKVNIDINKGKIFITY